MVRTAGQAQSTPRLDASGDAQPLPSRTERYTLAGIGRRASDDGLYCVAAGRETGCAVDVNHCANYVVSGGKKPFRASLEWKAEATVPTRAIPRRCALRFARAGRGRRNRVRGGWARDSGGLAFLRADRSPAGLTRQSAGPS